MEFRLLGEVELRAAGQLLDVGAPRQQAILVALATDAGRPVSIETLIGRIWAAAPPVEVRNVLYSHLSRIRRLLRQATTISGETSVRIERRHAGYVLDIAPNLVDLHRFRMLVGQGRDPRLVDAARVDALTEALSLWRGEPFAGLDTPWITALRETLEWDRFAVELDVTDLLLRHSDPGWLLSELAGRAEAHPLDERVAGQVMLALYRCGRQAEALEHFQRLRRRLAEELGIDPGPELRRRYEQILTTDSALDATFPVPETESPAMPVPRQLPAHTPHFVGRTAELDQLTTLLDSTKPPGGTVVIAAITGTAGIGKTALALHWAHQVAERFPDGQLYVNLRGFDPTGSPLSPTEVLREFFDAFEVPPGRIPTGVEAQAALYRNLLTDRHMLVVLDNARDADQVRPLLPASPTCLVMITSRDQLPGLVAREGARPVTLDVLTSEEARALLTGYLGPDRISAEPDAVTELVEHCARLPLALAVVAARANTHPRFALRVLAKELADAHTRLDALGTGEAATSVRAVFSWSYRRLSAPARRMFRLLGLHRGPDLPLPAATRLADLSPAEAQEVLGELTRAHLLTQHTPDRYTFHDLLRAYATDLTTSQDSQRDHHNAITRLFDHYLHTAIAAIDTLHLPDQQILSVPQMAVPATATAWLDAERVNLTAILAQTADLGWHTHTIRLAAAVLRRYLPLGRHYSDALALYDHVRLAVQHTGDHATEALALSNLGEVLQQQGRYPQAIEHHQAALTISRESGFRAGEAFALTSLGSVYWRQGHYMKAIEHHQAAQAICGACGLQSIEAFTLTNLGIVLTRQGRYPQAIAHHEKALGICREPGDRGVEVYALTNLGVVHWRQGRYQQAAEHHQNAVVIAREYGYRGGEAYALTNLGVVLCQQSRYANAIERLQEALTVCRESGFRPIEAFTLTSLGLVYVRQDRYRLAIEHHQDALAIFREAGDRNAQPQTLNGLAEAYHANGQHDQALRHHTTALSLATDIGDPYEQARAHHGLARTHHTTGDLDRVRHHRHQALILYSELNVPDIDSPDLNAAGRTP